MNAKSKNHTEEIYEVHYRKHRKHGLFAVILITLGALFLLSNLGLLPSNIWSDLWKLWPLILIIWGMQMMIGKSKAANIVIAILALIIAAIIIITLLSTTNPVIAAWLHTYFPGLFQTYPMNNGMPYHHYRMMYNYHQPLY